MGNQEALPGIDYLLEESRQRAIGQRALFALDEEEEV